MAEYYPAQRYAIVDTAQDDALYELVCCCMQSQCLISGMVPRELAGALPYLVRLRDGEPLTDAWALDGAGKHWGIMFDSSETIDQLRLHFKHFLNAILPDGRIAMFRFFDPRVFRTYLRAATHDERVPWFRYVARFLVEGETEGERHEFHLRGETLYDGARILPANQ